MNLSGSSIMEEIPLDDVDRASTEYRVLLAYAQRQLSASKYEQLLAKEAQGKEGSSSGKEDQRGRGHVPQDLPPKDASRPARNRSQKKKKQCKRPSWRHCLLPSCLREPAGTTVSSEDAVNGRALGPQGGVGGEPRVPQGDDPGISLVVDRLSEIIDHSRPRRTELRILVHSVSLEADGTIQVLSGDDDTKDEEERIINTIVALLRKSGDELQEQVKKDKTFSQLIYNLMTYSFFSKIATQFSEEAASGASEMETQVMKVACAAEVTAKLTAIDNHPMNIVLGFGTKYLKENFSPWINSHGGWEALGLSDQEEVE